MNALNNNVWCLGDYYSVEFISNLLNYFNSYYTDFFCKITPILIKFYYKSAIRNTESDSYYKCEIEDISKGDSSSIKEHLVDGSDVERKLIIPCLLGIYKTNTLKSFMIFPFSCKIRNSTIISNSCIEWFERILSHNDESIKNKVESSKIEKKVGFLEELEAGINETTNLKLLMSVHFNEERDFTIFEINFNHPLNYI